MENSYIVEKKSKFLLKFIMFVITIFLIVVNIFIFIKMYNFDQYRWLLVCSAVIVFISLILFFISIFWGNEKVLVNVDNSKIISHTEGGKFVLAWSEVNKIIISKSKIEIETKKGYSEFIYIARMRYASANGLINYLHELAQTQHLEITIEA